VQQDPELIKSFVLVCMIEERDKEDECLQFRMIELLQPLVLFALDFPSCQFFACLVFHSSLD
jgi:hypothetical protein